MKNMSTGQMQYIAFLVNQEPYCLWGYDLKEQSRSYLKGLDPDYFKYCLETHLETEDKKRASVAIRILLHQSLETLFTTIFAFLQAPHCPYAWINKCTTYELRNLVRATNASSTEIRTAFALEKLDWEDISRLIHSRLRSDKAYVISGYAQLWRRLANDFLNPLHIDEYNAFKHGFRAHSGGFKLAIGKQPSQSIPCPEEEMIALGESQFGSSYYRIAPVHGKVDRNLMAEHQSINWSIERDILLNQLIWTSLNNVISTMKIVNGWESSECQYQTPTDMDAFDAPWRHSPSIMNLRVGHQITKEYIDHFTKEDLLKKIYGEQS